VEVLHLQVSGVWGDWSPSLEIFKTRLDKVLCSLLWVTHRGAFQPPLFCDSVKECPDGRGWLAGCLGLWKSAGKGCSWDS